MATGTPAPAAAPARGRERRWPVPPRLAAAFLIATLFHLSMVTLFRIVVVFPETKAKFSRLQIISEAPPSEGGGTERASNGELRLRGPLLARAPDAKVDLPTMDFAELDRLRVRSGADTDAATMDRVFGPTDSWAKFAGGLQSLGQSLRDLAFPVPTAPSPEARRVVGKHHPAPGYDADIVWDGEPKNRELLFAPPISALAGAANAGLRWPVEVVLTVNPAGRVVNVWCAAVDDAGVVDAIQTAALQYRFAPLPADSPGATGPAANQMGTLSIRPAAEQP